jgi:hypothetical protein
MTTYTEAANAGYNRAMQLWNNGSGFAGTNDEFWLRGNTLRTVVIYMLAAGPNDNTGNFINFINFIGNELDYFEGTVPLNASDADLQTLSDNSKDNKGPWLDDYGWWAIAFMLAARNAVLKLDLITVNRLVLGAIHSWKIMNFGWDNSTGPVPGGVWNARNPCLINHPGSLVGRNCVTNELFWLTSMQLSGYTNQNYLGPNDSAKFFGDANGQNLLFIQVPSPVSLVCERFDEVASGFGKPGWFWAGDQGLFFACCRWARSPQNTVFNGEMAEQIGNQILDTMTDTPSQVLHDQVSPNTNFERDYATGKGVLLDQLGFRLDDANPTRLLARLPQFFRNNAAAVWNSRIPDSNQFLFNWNPNGQMPYYGGEPKDDLLGITADCLVLQVAGLSALIQGMKVAPNEQIPS